jgi:hypothetical protein
MRKALLAVLALSGFSVSTSFGAETLTTAGGFVYDINTTSGAVTEGTSDAYDDFPQLWIAGSLYNAPSYTMANGGRNVVMAPMNISNFSVSRTVYVPASGGNYAAYLETFTNNSPVDNTAFAISFGTAIGGAGDLGSDDETVVTASSSGDMNYAYGDYWFATDDAVPGFTGADDPALGHVIAGPNASILPFDSRHPEPDQFQTLYSLSLLPGETQSFLFFEIQENTRALSAAVAAQLTANPDVSFLSPAQIATIKNFSIVPEPASLGAISSFVPALLRRRRRD